MAVEAILHIVYSCLPDPPFYTELSLSAAIGGEEEEEEEEDRISNLPDELLCNIVSRLPTKDAARTAALSSRWRLIWRSTPLVLTDSALVPDLPAGTRYDWRAVTSAVSRVLASHPGPFRFVQLLGGFMDAEEDALAEWLALLAAKGVEDLVFVNRPWPLDVTLPADILRCASLRRLYLGVWGFPDTAGHPRSPDVFPRLQELGICHSIMEERDLEHVLACSPALETFALIVSYGTPSRVRIESHSLCCVLLWFSMLDELTVVAAPCLKRVILCMTRPTEETETIKVKIGHAPQLTVLGYLETGVHAVEIGGTVIKAGMTNVSPSATIPSVKILALSVDFEVINELRILPIFLKCFPRVETLHVRVSDGTFESDGDEIPGDTSESSGSLDPAFWQDVGSVECVQSHVKKVVFDQFSGGINELQFAKFILERAKMLQKMVFVVDGGNSSFVDQVVSKVRSLASTNFACEECALMIAGRREGYALSYSRASDLSLSDPFMFSKHI